MFEYSLSKFRSRISRMDHLIDADDAGWYNSILRTSRHVQTQVNRFAALTTFEREHIKHGIHDVGIRIQLKNIRAAFADIDAKQMELVSSDLLTNIDVGL